MTTVRHNFVALAKALLIKYPFIDLGQQNPNSTSRRISLSLVRPANGLLALDAGCREGRQTEILRSKGYQVIPVDVVNLFPEARLVNLNETLPFNQDLFDLIYCSEVIEHLIDPFFTVSEFNRVLKPSGTMIITTPNSFCFFFNLLSLFGITTEMINKHDHLHFFSMKDILQLFPNAEILGFFPFLFNFRITKFVGSISPVFIIMRGKATVQNL